MLTSRVGVRREVTIQLAITWDYRCPFARNAHEHVTAALRSGADLEARFVPFSLGQVHVAEGDPDVWDEPKKDSGLLALQAGVVVRDRFPDKFLDAHDALFAVRHDKGQHLWDQTQLTEALVSVGVDAAAVWEEVATGGPLATVREEHEQAAKEHSVWGVPTFVGYGASVFVRVMDRPRGDGAKATRTIERVHDLLTGWPELNEFKHTSIPR